MIKIIPAINVHLVLLLTDDHSFKIIPHTLAIEYDECHVKDPRARAVAKLAFAHSVKKN